LRYVKQSDGRPPRTSELLAPAPPGRVSIDCRQERGLRPGARNCGKSNAARPIWLRFFVEELFETRIVNTYLITYNPKRTGWFSSAELAALKAKGYTDSNWSCINKHIVPGDRLLLLRQGVEPRGLVASGRATSMPYSGSHWDQKGWRGRAPATATYVKARFDTVLDQEREILPLAQVESIDVHWRTQASGILVAPRAAAQLEELWGKHLRKVGKTPKVLPILYAPKQYLEGAPRVTVVNYWERDRGARDACIEYYGTTCVVCGFDFERRYGELGKGFIHVHHLYPPRDDGEHDVNPVSDLRPVCPNCHSMLHRKTEVLSIEELRRNLR